MPYTFDQKVAYVKRRLSGETLSDVGIPSKYIRLLERNPKILQAAADELGIPFDQANEYLNAFAQERLREARRRGKIFNAYSRRS